MPHPSAITGSTTGVGSTGHRRSGWVAQRRRYLMGAKTEALDHIITQLDGITELLAQLVQHADKD